MCDQYCEKAIKSMKISMIALAAVAASPVSASVTCVKVGATATAQWTNKAGEACTWTGVVGSNFGTDDVNDGK